ncbi:MAG: molybdate transporter substrate-binding protein, partial [Steroidobacteraceae bacterium]|nr:molybdate transporter substrate-binding protein [Steroidobacteraceae bacterium]
MPRRWLLLLVSALVPQLASGVTPARVYAAASLTLALTEVADRWQRAGHPAPVMVFAGSATLARQLAAGAPADVFVSADATWMDELAASDRIDRDSRVDLLGNAVVLVAPRDASFRVELRPGSALAQAFAGRLCTGEPGVVPIGTRAREALQWMGAWDALRPRIVFTDDVRAALAFVERGHCAAGIVYETDAKGSTRVVTIARFPDSSHRAVVYPAALLQRAGPEGRAFFAFLRDSPEVADLFSRHGFRVL